MQVSRAPGQPTTRYVIDYYYDDAQAGTDVVPALGMRADPAATRSIVVDVRPALDSLGAVYHRLRRAPGAAASVASFSAAVLTGIYLCTVCSCQEILRRNGRG